MERFLKNCIDVIEEKQLVGSSHVAGSLVVCSQSRGDGDRIGIVKRENCVQKSRQLESIIESGLLCVCNFFAAQRETTLYIAVSSTSPTVSVVNLQCIIRPRNEL